MRGAQTLRQMGPQRRAAVAAAVAVAVAVWERTPALARYVLKRHNNVEGVFSVLSVAMRLGHTLPTFVRGLDRVTRWVGGKIILYHARLLVQAVQAAHTPATG